METPLVSAEWKQIMNALNGFVLSDALYSASELDLFTKIEVSADPVLENLAADCDLSLHAMRVLLLACCSTGLIERNLETGKYRNSTAAQKALLSTRKENLRDFVRFNHDVQQRCGFRLLDSLRANSNKGLEELPGVNSSLYDRLSESPGQLELFQSGMSAYSLFGPKIVAFEELANVQHLIDVGGGSGAVAARLSKMHKDMRVTVLERPQVCKLARSQNLERIDFQEADVFQDAWPLDADAVLFSHFLEIFSLAKIENLYRKAFAALPQGGRVFVWTLSSETGEIGGLQAAKSSTYFLGVASGEGMAYPVEQHLELLKRVGFEIERIYDRQEFDHMGIVAKKI